MWTDNEVELVLNVKLEYQVNKILERRCTFIQTCVKSPTGKDLTISSLVMSAIYSEIVHVKHDVKQKGHARKPNFLNTHTSKAELFK